ncbi:SDR family NAD(P)-dependent oxidoreductase [Nocardioides sp.]|uniref:SDR family NAD(P)-dependent oxidoreductase n=1 Tax=Nocardioides sp. TaxID=35761 RepID=UPI003D14BB5E
MSSQPARQGTALITGATAGIGHEFARQLAAEGRDLVLVARTTERLNQVAAALTEEYAVHVEVLSADLTDRAQLALVEQRLSDPSRPVDLLVNNAGFGLKHRFLVNDVEDEQQMLDILVTAVLRLSHAALKQMVVRGSGGVINVSSVAAFLPRGSYSAAKAWVNSFSRWAANEYAPKGITVTAVCPGFVKTEFHERMQVKRGTGFLWLEPERLVREALQDYDEGKVISIPTRRYRTIVRVSRLVPTGLAQRAQRIGRR